MPVPRLVLSSILLGGLAAAEPALDPRVQRVIDDYRAELHEAAERYRATAADARADAVRDLKRQIRSSTPVPERVAIMREVLRIEREDGEAREFFLAIGTLEDELAALGEEPAAAVETVDLLAPGPALPDLKGLVAASPAAADLAAALKADPAAAVVAAFAGFAEDQVGSAGDGSPNGRPDGRIDLLVPRPLGPVERIDVASRGAWTTAPGSHWILGAVVNGHRVNPVKSPPPLVDLAGPALVSCYCDDAESRWPGAQVVLTLRLMDGTEHRLQVVVPAVPAVGGAAATRR